MIAVIGAGITGLVAAYRLKLAGQEVQVFDGANILGGNLQTLKVGPYQLELGPNSLVLSDALYDFLAEIDLAKEIQTAEPTAKHRYILRDGGYQKLPTGPVSMLLSSTFSWSAKRQIMREPRVLATGAQGETIDAFFRRRIGDELTDYIVHPFISGVFAGDPKTLLIESAFPRIHSLETTYGSLLKGMRARAKTQQHKGTITFRQGIGSLPAKLADLIGEDIFLNHKLQAIHPQEKGFRLVFSHNQYQADQLLLALPAYRIAPLMEEIYPAWRPLLDAIDYPPVSMVFSAYKRAAVYHALDGFGALHNHREESFTLGSIFTSSVFAGRCPADEVLLTTFVGGARQPDHATLPDAVLKTRVHEELKKRLDIQAVPVFQHLQRWPRAIPQYTAAALPAQSQVEDLQAQGIWLAGNWVGGISVPDSIQRGIKLADQLLESASA